MVRLTKKTSTSGQVYYQSAKHSATVYEEDGFWTLTQRGHLICCRGTKKECVEEIFTGDVEEFSKYIKTRKFH